MYMIKIQKECVADKLAFIDSLDVDQEEKDLMKQYVHLMNTQTVYVDDNNETVAIIN